MGHHEYACAPHISGLCPKYINSPQTTKPKCQTSQTAKQNMFLYILSFIAIIDMNVDPSNDKHLLDIILTILIGTHHMIPYVSAATILIDKHLVDWTGGILPSNSRGHVLSPSQVYSD